MPYRPLRTAAATLALALLVVLAGAIVVVFSGAYDVAADRPHLQWIHSTLELTMQKSVQRRARSIEERPPPPATVVQRGAACFRSHCVACHGAPGVAAEPAGLAMQPLPGPLVDVARQWRLRELVWITRHGIRLSGMPAWQGRLADEDIWAVAALVKQLPALSPADWQALAHSVEGTRCETVAAGAGPLGVATAPMQGRRILERHACHGCHVIPGVVGSQRHVGPPLAGFARRTQIAGRLPNTRENLVAWIRDPQRIDPGSAMPATGVGEADAQAIATYLLSLR